MSKNTEGNWMWYADQIKAQLGRTLTEVEYKDVFRKYISGVKWNVAIEGLK